MMTKKLKIVRKLIAISMVIIMGMDCFAAIVSDNDGSAFVTKAEFDSLKKSFQKQIDNYNDSIDSKIDGAIASYLSGINIQKSYIVKSELSGRKAVILNLDKQDKLKAGKMNFDIKAQTMNWPLAGNNPDNPDFTPDARDTDNSSGISFVHFGRENPDFGTGFEVWRVDKNNKLWYYDDLRFSWTVSRQLAAERGSGSTFFGTENWVRWHAGYSGKKTSNGNDEPADSSSGTGKYSDLVSNPSFCSFWQTGGCAITCDAWILVNSNPHMNSYSSTVNTMDYGNTYCILTDGITGLSNNIFCKFTGDDWSTDLLTQETALYPRYDYTTYRYDLPSDAGLTINEACAWSFPDWNYFNDVDTTTSPITVGSEYHKADLMPTMLPGITWVKYGTFMTQVGSSGSTSGNVNADYFYEIVPRLFSSNLNILKDEVALSSVTTTYVGWDGFLYQGLPFGTTEKAGQIEFTLDLSSAQDDLYLMIGTEPFANNKSIRSCTGDGFPSGIIGFAVDGAAKTTKCCQINKGSQHTINITVDKSTPIYYKLAPVDANSKKKSIITIPAEYKFIIED